MTNEQAIEFFKGQKEVFGKDSLMYEAIEKAIKALEQENVTYTGYDEGYEDGYEDGQNTVCLDIFNMVEKYKEEVLK